MNALKVELGTIEVGTLEMFADCAHRFTFSEGYISRLLPDRPVLGQLFEDRFPHSVDVDGPICWFSHLLPQGVMRTWRSRLLGIDGDDDFALLTELGEDMPGAVRLSPTRSLLATEDQQFVVTPTPSDDTSVLKFSLAGAQWKLSTRSSGRGLTTRAKGDGRAYIAKFDAPEYPNLPECEFATMTWAKETGVSVPEIDLRSVDDIDVIPEGMPIGNGTVYTIERFDRVNSSRIHIEDFGQILDRPPGSGQYHGSYEEIAEVLSWLDPASTVEFLKQIVFAVVCGNGDAHLKNFSVIYSDGRNAELSLAYDVVSTICYYAPNRESLSLTLGGIRKFSDVTLDSFQSLFRALRIDSLTGESLVRDTVKRAVDKWSCPGIRDGYSNRHQERIDQHLDSLEIVKL